MIPIYRTHLHDPSCNLKKTKNGWGRGVESLGHDTSWIVRDFLKTWNDWMAYGVYGRIPWSFPNMECNDSSPRKSSLRIA